MSNKNIKSLSQAISPQSDTNLHTNLCFLSPQPDTTLHCQTRMQGGR